MNTETKKLKIFELRSSIGKEWISGITNIDALQTYLSILNIELSELPSDSEIGELPEDVWKDYSIYDEDEDSHTSFEEYMKTQTYPDIIAGTMYNDY